MKVLCRVKAEVYARFQEMMEKAIQNVYNIHRIRNIDKRLPGSRSASAQLRGPAVAAGGFNLL